LITIKYLLGYLKGLVRKTSALPVQAEEDNVIRSVGRAYDGDALILLNTEPLTFEGDVILGFGPDGNFRRL